MEKNRIFLAVAAVAVGAQAAPVDINVGPAYPGLRDMPGPTGFR